MALDMPLREVLALGIVTLAHFDTLYTIYLMKAEGAIKYKENLAQGQAHLIRRSY